MKLEKSLFNVKKSEMKDAEKALEILPEGTFPVNRVKEFSFLGMVGFLEDGRDRKFYAFHLDGFDNNKYERIYVPSEAAKVNISFGNNPFLDFEYGDYAYVFINFRS